MAEALRTRLHNPIATDEQRRVFVAIALALPQQLFHYGVAASVEATKLLFLAKWLPAPLFPHEVPGRYLTPALARDLLTDDRLQQSSRHLQQGSAMEALGWSHEAQGKLGHEGEDLFNASPCTRISPAPPADLSKSPLFIARFLPITRRDPCSMRP